MPKLEFPGKVGQVSGFDTESDAAAMLLLESFLAGYARIAIQPTGSGNSTRNIVMRPVDMGTYGRHFFLLPKDIKHEVFRVGYKQEDRPEGERKRTIIHSHLAKQEFFKATRDTIVNANSGKVPPNFPLASEAGEVVWELYYLDIKSSDPKDKAYNGPRMGWNDRDYFVFMIRSSYPRGAAWCFLSFFKRGAELNAHSQAVVTYEKHLIAGNVTNVDIVPCYLDTKKRTFVEMPEITVQSSSIIAEALVPNRFSPSALRRGNAPLKYEILPSVVFTSENGYILTSWAHPYMSLLSKYIATIGKSLDIVDDKIVGVFSTRSEPDYELVLGMDGEELIYITTNFVARSQQHLTSIAMKDPNMAHLVFGSNPEWEKQGKPETEMVSSPGFGCLYNIACKKAVEGLADPTWLGFISSTSKNSKYHEMLGRTSDEIDSLLFADAGFYRSFIGKSVSYVDAVGHWMRKQNTDETILYSDRDIDDMEVAAKRIYKKAFESYIDNIIRGMILNEASASGETKARSNYIQTLQDGYVFKGYSMRGKEPQDDTTKLIYAIAGNKYLGIRGAVGEKVCKKIEGGLYLYASRTDIKPRSSTDILVRRSTDSTVPIEKVRAAYGDLIQTAYCPYGYVARSLYKIMAFVGGHVDFFPTTRVGGIIGGEVKLYKPNNCIASQVSVVSTVGNDDYLDATPIKLFVNHSADDRTSEVTNKKYLSITRYLKELWMSYIFTKTYIRELLPLRNIDGLDLAPGTIQKRKDINDERIFALGLARRLRLNKAIITMAKSEGIKIITEELVRQKKHREVVRLYGEKSVAGRTGAEILRQRDSICVNIYDLLPYYEKPEEKLDAAALRARGIRDLFEHQEEARMRNRERLETLEAKYPNVVRNFYTNCDTIYTQDRLNLLWEEYRIRDSKDNEDDPLGGFTNLDYVNGYLFVENFILQRDGRNEGYPAYMSREQYMAMSASVIYAKEGINERMTFMELAKQSDSSSESEEEEETVSQETSSFKDRPVIRKNTVIDGIATSIDYDVVEMFGNDRGCKVLFANIANVPVYNVDAGRNADGDIFVSTLNEALSVNSSVVYMLARSLHVKPELHAKTDGFLKFDFIQGREAQTRRDGVSEMNEHRKTAPTSSTVNEVIEAALGLTPDGELNLGAARGANTLWSAGAAPPASSGGSINFSTAMEQEGQDMVVQKSYSLIARDIVKRVRSHLGGKEYIPKGQRASILLAEAAINRTSLRDFAPTSRKNANEKTLRETIITAEFQVPRLITVDGHDTKHGNTIPVVEYSDEDLQEYLHLIGAQ